MSLRPKHRRNGTPSPPPPPPTNVLPGLERAELGWSSQASPASDQAHRARLATWPQRRAGANSTLYAMADDGDDVLEGEMQCGDSRLASNACLSDQPAAQEGAVETTMTVTASVCSAVATLFTSQRGDHDDRSTRSGVHARQNTHNPVGHDPTGIDDQHVCAPKPCMHSLILPSSSVKRGRMSWDVAASTV
jgi:hypothetical protein